MSVNKRSMAHAWVDPDDAPDLSSPEWKAKFEAALVKRGRPKWMPPSSLSRCAYHRPCSITSRPAEPDGRPASVRHWSAL